MLGCSFHALSEIDSCYSPTLILQAPDYEGNLFLLHCCGFEMLQTPTKKKVGHKTIKTLDV